MEYSLLCMVSLVLGLIPATIANSKGHNFVGWWLFGAFIFIVALPVAILVAPKETPDFNKLGGGGATRQCPFCAETIKRDAVVCRFCNRDLPALESTNRYLADDEIKSLTYRQQRVLTDFSYLLSVEAAEEVGAMLGNFTSRKKIEDFVKQYGELVER